MAANDAPVAVLDADDAIACLQYLASRLTEFGAAETHRAMAERVASALAGDALVTVTELQGGFVHPLDRSFLVPTDAQRWVHGPVFRVRPSPALFNLVADLQEEEVRQARLEAHSRLFSHPPVPANGPSSFGDRTT